MTKIAIFNHWLFWSNGCNSICSLSNHFLLVFLLSPPDSHVSLCASLYWDFISSFYSSSFFTIAILILQTQTIITVTSARSHHHIRHLLLLVPHLRGPQSHPPPPCSSTTSDHLLHYHHYFCLNRILLLLLPLPLPLLFYLLKSQRFLFHIFFRSRFVNGDDAGETGDGGDRGLKQT